MGFTEMKWNIDKINIKDIWIIQTDLEVETWADNTLGTKLILRWTNSLI